MQLPPKTRLGPYEILGPLGSGGMGDVYKARDTRLERAVAIKICTGRFTDRFEREARAISSLAHPHICALYDIGHENSTDFLVMEHIEGETLESRLRNGPLPVTEALTYAIQIAGALDAAHRKGIIHRDLKPGNVMLTDGGAKLLDFGLAKILAAGAAGTATSMPTMAQPLTTEGAILGTFQYMSPEQLEGRESDTRSDIFSFGATLYEMICGRKAFSGGSQASLIAAVMSADPPPLSAVQPMASPVLDRIARKCLAKSPDDRWQSARDLVSELQWVAESGSQAGIPAPPLPPPRTRARLPWWLAAVSTLLFLVSAACAVALLRERSAPAETVHFQIPAPDKLSFHFWDVPAVSPDGSRIAFTAGTGTDINQLLVRTIDAPAPAVISLAGPAYLPFWSPDGRQIAFTTRGALQKVDVSGGPPITLCQYDGNAAPGTWSREGVILAVIRGQLHRLPATGGEPKPLGALVKGESLQRSPQFLPDGKHFLYLSSNSDPNLQGIYVGSLDGGPSRFVVASEYGAVYSPTGHLLFVRGSTLMAQKFDLGSWKLQEEARPVTNRIALMTGFAPPPLSAAANAVVWREGTGLSRTELRWFDRTGKSLGAVGEGGEMSNPALSPDEKKVAVGIMDPQARTRDIWIIDLVRGARTRLTFDPADDLNPVFSPDGARIAFTSNRKGERDIYLMLADGSGQPELLLEGKDGQKNLEDWSPDGKYLTYNHQPGRDRHIYALPVEGDHKPVPVLKTPQRTLDSQVSPNGRWLSYDSTESGRSEIYVQGFRLDPAQPHGKWQVSTSGGLDARWRRDGKELFYYDGKSIMAVEVKTDGPSFEAGIPQRLFDVRLPPGGRNRYVVSRDGRRFLAITFPEQAAEAPLQVVVNWR